MVSAEAITLFDKNNGMRGIMRPGNLSGGCNVLVGLAMLQVTS